MAAGSPGCEGEPVPSILQDLDPSTKSGAAARVLRERPELEGHHVNRVQDLKGVQDLKLLQFKPSDRTGLFL